MKGRNHKFEWQEALTAAGLTASTTIVGLALSFRWNGDDRRLPYATYKSLAQATTYSEATVKRALSQLREGGWIAQARRGGSHRGASVYRLTYPNNGSVVTHSNGSSVKDNGSVVTHQQVSSDPPLDQSLDQNIRPTRTPPVGLAGDMRERLPGHPCHTTCRWGDAMGADSRCPTDQVCDENLWKLYDHLQILNGVTE